MVVITGSDLGEQRLNRGAQRGKVVVDHLGLHHDHHQSLWEDVVFCGLLADRSQAPAELVADNRIANSPRNRVGHLAWRREGARLDVDAPIEVRGETHRHRVAPKGPASPPEGGELSSGANTPDDSGASTVRRRDGGGPSGDGSSRWPDRRDRPCDGESHAGAHDGGCWAGRFSSRCASSASKVRIGPGCSALCGLATKRSGMRRRVHAPRRGNRRRARREPATSRVAGRSVQPSAWKQTVRRCGWIPAREPGARRLARRPRRPRTGPAAAPR